MVIPAPQLSSTITTTATTTATATTTTTKQKPLLPCPRIIEAVKTSTAMHLESIAQAFISAVNARNFDITTYPYKDHISSAFEGDLECGPNDMAEWGRGGGGEGGKEMMMGLEAQMRMYRVVTEVYPDYWIRIFDLNTYVDEKAGKALMYFNGETEGLGDGVKIPSLGTLEFQRYSEQWKCLCFRGVRGVVDGCVGARYES